MIRLLGFCTILFLLYLSFILLEQLDSRILITAYDDYIIETTIFVSLGLIAITVCLIIIILKIISLFFEIPYLINKQLDKNNAQKTVALLMQAMAYLMLGDKQNSLLIIKKLPTKIKPEYQELYDIINAETEKDFEKQIQYFKQLTSSKNYNYFSLKRLAQIFHQRELFEQAEKYATLAYNLVEVDSDILEILIDCYAKLGIWNKFVVTVAKYSRVNPIRLTTLANKIAKHYLTTAKYYLELGEDKEAVHYLESALELYPTYLEALDLYFTINASLSKTTNRLSILKSAFTAEPSFAIAEIYIKFANMPADIIYKELSNQIDRRLYWHLLIAIATYLNLPEQIQALSVQCHLNNRGDLVKLAGSPPLLR